MCVRLAVARAQIYLQNFHLLERYFKMYVKVSCGGGRFGLLLVPRMVQVRARACVYLISERREKKFTKSE